MTTMYLTDDFLLTDRSVGNGWEYNKTTTIKHTLLRHGDREYVVGLGGFLNQTTMNKSIWRRLGLAMTWILEEQGIRSPDDSETLKKLIDNEVEKNRQFLDNLVGEGILFYIDKRGAYYYQNGTAYYMVKGQTHFYGSGGNLAMYAHQLGAKPEEIMGIVSAVDNMSTPEFDLTYFREFK